MARTLSTYEKLELQACIKRVEEQANPSTNDIRYSVYVRYVNSFLETIGSKEKVYLIGSTGEETKLRFTHRDECDIDLLFVSGRFEISSKDIVRNSNCACYSWIRADELSKKLGLKRIEERYLSANSLREVKPELFTFLRALHMQLTASFREHPDFQQQDTVLSVSTKVGLASNSYRGLRFSGALIPGGLQHDSEPFVNKLPELKTSRRTVKKHKNDSDFLRKVFKIVQVAKYPGGRGSNNGRLAFYAQALTDFMEQNGGLYVIDGEEARVNYSDDGKDAKESFNCVCDEQDNLIYSNHFEEHLTVKATYEELDHKDFVPAIRISGKIEEMKTWRQRVEAEKWPASKILDIWSSDIFVVARICPMNPNLLKDFCFSFNLHENKLVRHFSSIQRQVYLIMKAYLKGHFAKVFSDDRRPLHVKTFHIKTALFWMLEKQYTESETSDVHELLQRFLMYFRSKLTERNLPHYFINSANLLCDFEEEDYRLIVECVDYVIENPLKALKYFFDLDDGRSKEIILSPEEVSCLFAISVDKGMGQFVNTFQEVLTDIHMGLNEVARDSRGNTAAKKALFQMCKLFISDERQTDTRIFKQINDFLRGEGVDTNRDMKDVNDKIEAAISLAESIGMFLPDVQRFLQVFSGRPFLKDILRGAFGEKPVDFNSDLGDQILETLERFLACSADEEDDVLSELTYKTLGYFSGRQEFPHLSGLRL